MSDLRDFPTKHGAEPRDELRDEREVQRLLEEAGPRPQVAPRDLDAVKSAFRAEWRRQVGAPTQPERSSWKPSRALALAAMMILTLGLGAWWWLRTQPVPGPGFAAAQVEVAHGTVQLRGPAPSSWSALPPGTEIRPGAELRTAPGPDSLPGRVALRLDSGAAPSVRLDAGSQARIVSASVIELQRGALYVDTGYVDTGRADVDSQDGTGHAGSRSQRAVEIRTPFGRVTDIGTQFEVRLLPGETGGRPGAESLRVRVREGEVRVEQDGVSESAGVGEELTMYADGAFDRSEIQIHGDPWAWVLATAPAFDIEGRTLRDFLEWVARETGWRIRYGDAELERRADTIVLHGSLAGVSPDQAPDVVLPGAGLSASRVEDTLWVSR